MSTFPPMPTCRKRNFPTAETTTPAQKSRFPSNLKQEPSKKARTDVCHSTTLCKDTAQPFTTPPNKHKPAAQTSSKQSKNHSPKYPNKINISGTGCLTNPPVSAKTNQAQIDALARESLSTIQSNPALQALAWQAADIKQQTSERYPKGSQFDIRESILSIWSIW